MDPSDKNLATFCQHKPHKPGKAPPVCSVISGSGSSAQNISHFIQTKDDQIKDASETKMNAERNANVGPAELVSLSRLPNLSEPRQPLIVPGPL